MQVEQRHVDRLARLVRGKGNTEHTKRDMKKVAKEDSLSTSKGDSTHVGSGIVRFT